MAAIADHDLLGRFARLRTERLQFLNDIHALDDGPENDVPVVQPGGLHGGDKELGTVGVRARVCHRHYSRTGVFQLEVLIVEFVTVHRFSAGAVMVCKIATLAHEVGDDAVESGSLVTETLLSRAQGAEVFTRLRNNVRPQLEIIIKNKLKHLNTE